MQQENSEPVLYQGKAFTTWKQAFETIESRAKQQGFNIIYSRVEKKSDGTFCRRTAQCEHHGNYVTKSNKETTTKRLGCAWHINLSEPTFKNPFKYVYITTLHEIEFLTIKCRMGSATQRQYLEAKFPGQIIYDNDLYKAIQHFRPQNKDDSNDAAKLYTKLLELSQNNLMWKVAIKFDNNNTLTHLFWMMPSQLELWYRYSDIVVQDVTYSKESHEWSFEQLNLATNNVYPQVIMTDADPAVHAAIRSTFPTTYPMHCTFHISQNLIKKVQKLIGNKFQEFFTKFHAVRNTLNTLSFESEWRKLITQYPEIQQYLINTLYNTKESWAHPWTCHQFTAGLHASSPVESINAWIKSYIFNSNISLCELGDVIERRQMAENKKYQLVLWKAAIPCVPTQISTAAFMFTSINQKLEEYLPPAILELQRDEIRQCVFYNAVQVTQEVIDEFDKYDLLLGQYLEDVSDAHQITAACMISNINKDQISSMWAVNVENKLVEKHFIILLINGSHYCSCLSLINRGIICRYYFQIMLRNPAARFHLRLIPSQWYYRNKDPSKEQFLVASKFENEITPLIPQYNVPFLTAICKTSQEFIARHEQLTDIQLYGKIAGLSHKATMKAVSKRDIRIIHILENYLKDVDEEQGEKQNENIELEDTKDDESDKENFPFILNNPNKQTRSKGRPKGTKRIKASHEKEKTTTSSVNSKQYKCGNCGDMGHNKRNCNILR
ncbi:hypothetical protein GLOIN_2v1796089 [Rhizophagus irregularis DAOM 181602=DAOM 197198]|nr:hypothetical protein GLOIN_2v1796089 [Rhizophagus irregularis DAOM 181602=DAOM 197198]